MKKRKTTTCITLDQERKSIKHLITEKKQEIKHQVEIYQVLKKYDIRSPYDIDKMTWNSDKSLLVRDNSEPTLYKLYVPFMLLHPQTNLVEMTHEHINKGKTFSLEVLSTCDIEKLKSLSIESPTEEQLNDTRYYASADIDHKYIWSIESEPYALTEMYRLREKKANEITAEEVISIYYKEKIRQFVEGAKNEYLRNLTKKQVQAHYQSNIDKLNKELETFIYLMNNQTQTSRGLATPNDLRTATMGTRQALKWRDVDKPHQDKVKELLKSTAPEILDRLEDDENPDEIISQFIGIKLSKRELRVLKPLRAIIDRAYKLGEIQDYSHKIKIYTSDFYKEYGLKARKEGGYDDNQTHPIREILFNGKSNLTRRIFFNNSKYQKVMITAFILKLEWDNNNNYFEVMLDDIIFVKDKSDKYSYYYENLQGLNRLMELMPRSDAAFELHEYLEYSLKVTNHEFGLTKLLNASPTLEKRYKKDKNVTIQRLEKILDQMIKANTLITAWEKVEGKNEIKYILTNLYKAEKENNKKGQLIQIKQNR